METKLCLGQPGPRGFESRHSQCDFQTEDIQVASSCQNQTGIALIKLAHLDRFTKNATFLNAIIIFEMVDNASGNWRSLQPEW